MDATISNDDKITSIVCHRADDNEDWFTIYGPNCNSLVHIFMHPQKFLALMQGAVNDAYVPAEAADATSKAEQAAVDAWADEHAAEINRIVRAYAEQSPCTT